MTPRLRLLARYGETTPFLGGEGDIVADRIDLYLGQRRVFHLFEKGDADVLDDLPH